MFVCLTCAVPTFGIETSLIRALINSELVLIDLRVVFIMYAGTAVCVFILINMVLSTCSEVLARRIFVTVFAISSITASLFTLLSCQNPEYKVNFMLVSIACLNVASSVIMMPLVGSYHECNPEPTACFSINLTGSVFSMAIIFGRVLLECEDLATGGAIDRLDIAEFSTASYANLAASILVVCLYLATARR
jgi:hypothetical protein